MIDVYANLYLYTYDESGNLIGGEPKITRYEVSECTVNSFKTEYEQEYFKGLGDKPSYCI